MLFSDLKCLLPIAIVHFTPDLPKRLLFAWRRSNFRPKAEKVSHSSMNHGRDRHSVNLDLKLAIELVPGESRRQSMYPQHCGALHCHRVVGGA